MNYPNWIGQTLGGRYRIDELIGQGGMSAVYKAYDPNLKRIVAIKLIHSHLAEDPRFVVRFEEEAAAVAQLRHANIVQVYDFNHDGNVYYMVQEFLPGETLQDRLRRINKSGRRMAVPDAVGYTLNICEAAGYAHKRGMVHRDIKPANIMLDVQNQAILMDFGIVKIVGGQKHTATGAVVGTAQYLPPEVIRGETPDPRSDLYSLGVTLYEMVSGRPPFESDSAMTLMMMHLNDPVPSMRSLRPEVPDEVIAVIEKSLAKDRSQRHATMADFAADLKTAVMAFGAAPLQSTQADAPAESFSDLTTPVIAAAASATAVPLQSTQADAPSEAPASIIPPTLAATAAGAATPEMISAPTPVPDAPTEMEPAVAASAGAGYVSVPAPAPVPAQKENVAADSAPPPPSAPVQPAASAKPSRSLLWIILGIAAVAVISLGIILSTRNSSEKTAEFTPTTANLLSTSTPLAVVVPPTSTHTPPPPTVTAPPTPTLPPTPIPTRTATPTATIPAGVPYAVIKGITTEGPAYLVDYDTFDYKETLPGQHVHFFFNTTPPDQAGNPGTGPWYVWGGPRPFNRFLLNMRPADATQICVLVANDDHTVKPDSGNCVIVPDVNVAAPFEAQACRSGAHPSFPAVAQLQGGQLVMVNGISPDEAWWNIQSPDNPKIDCWLERSESAFQGDLSSLPLIVPPTPEPGKAGSEMKVEITGITLDAAGNYVVDYTVAGFEQKLPGTHIHFYWDIFKDEQVGPASLGKRLMYGGPSPFTGFSRLDRPDAAAQICALVADPEHNVIPGSGNCFDLP